MSTVLFVIISVYEEKAVDQQKPKNKTTCRDSEGRAGQQQDCNSIGLKRLRDEEKINNCLVSRVPSPVSVLSPPVSYRNSVLTGSLESQIQDNWKKEVLFIFHMFALLHFSLTFSLLNVR